MFPKILGLNLTKEAHDRVQAGSGFTQLVSMILEAFISHHYQMGRYRKKSCLN